MPAKKTTGLLGKWAFIAGVAIAAIVGSGLLVQLDVTWISVLVVLGLIIGLLNVGAKEASPFLLAGVSLVLVSAFGRDVLGTIALIGNVLDGIITLVVPATVVVALREVFEMAR